MTRGEGGSSARRPPSRHRWGRVRQLPSGRWQARVPDPARAGRLIPAPQTYVKRVDAERWLAAQETDQDRGAWVDPSVGRITFEAWADQWLEGGHKRESTLARDRHVLRAHLKPALGSQAISSITPLDVRRVVEGMVAAGLAPSTIRTNYGVLKAVLNGAVDAELILRSPCRGIRLQPDVHRERQTLGLQDLARITSIMPLRYRAIVYLGAVLGLRWSEVAALRIKRVDFLRSTITIAEAAPEVDGTPVIGKPKTRAAIRTMAVPAFVMDMLSEHLARRGLTAQDGEQLVFVAPGGGPLRASNFRTRVWKPAVEEAGYPDLTFHGLRHVAASLMVEEDAHPRVMQHRLGHSTARLSMELYAHVSDVADKEVATRLQALFSETRGTQGARGTENGRQ